MDVIEHGNPHTSTEFIRLCELGSNPVPAIEIGKPPANDPEPPEVVAVVAIVIVVFNVEAGWAYPTLFTSTCRL